MKYKKLGNTGVKVSEVCFGVMTFGKEADFNESKAIFHLCRDAGINFFDCADIYAKGKSEEILGDLIKTCRQEIILTSKTYYPLTDDVNAGGLSRKHIIRSVENSLRRLKTDYLDLYFFHHYDKNIHPEDALRALDDLITSGKVIYAGASNFAAWQIMKYLGISRQNRFHEFKCIQPMYNLIKRQAEAEILPMAVSENLGVVSYSPLAGEILTGKYSDNPQSIGRLNENEMYQNRYQNFLEASKRFQHLAENRGFTPTALAIAWVASNPAITSPILGARNVNQLKGSLDYQNLQIDEGLKQELDQIFPPPPLATDREEER